MCLVDAVHGDPGKIAANDESPDSVALSHVRVEVEQLYSSRLVVSVEHNIGSSSIIVTLDDDGNEGGKHDSGLEHDDQVLYKLAKLSTTDKNHKLKPNLRNITNDCKINNIQDTKGKMCTV